MPEIGCAHQDIGTAELSLQPSVTAEALRRKFLGALKRRVTQRDIWRIIVEDPWYQQQLTRCSSAVARQQQLPSHWIDDIRQSAMVLMGRHLQKRVDLKIDRRRAQRRFASWMRAIIIRDCRHALRDLRRTYVSSTPIFDSTLISADLLDERIDVQFAVERLREPEKTIVRLFSFGCTLSEVSQQVHLTYDQVRHRLGRGLGKIERTIGPAYRRKPELKHLMEPRHDGHRCKT